MNNHKFTQMVREFPFIKKILDEQNFSADVIGGIRVARGDRNLLEVTPSAWAHDAGEHGSHEGHRFFWAVSSDEVVRLESSWSRSIPFKRNDQNSVANIGSQLRALGHNVDFIVEVHAEGWDHEDKTPGVVIYKMPKD